MNKDLTTYVKCFENVFSREFCTDVVSELTKANWETHSFYNASHDEYISYDNELSVTNYSFEKKNEMMKKLWFVIKEYIEFLEMGDWFSGWNGYSDVRFNKYDVDTQMKIHCDHIHSMFDGQRKGVPVLTILGALNNDYEGGDFIMWQDTKIEMPTGSVLIFPSNFLYPHRVDAVTKGVRHSYVSWVW